jgi:hypothetical protein
MIPVETIPGIGGRRRMVEKVNSCVIYLIHRKNHNVPPPSTTIKENN